MKLKRLFTAVLSTALALSLCAMPAMAVEGAPGTTGTPADGTPVWSRATGSITIHKFEYNPASGTEDQLGTGAAGETAPTGATPLDGVTFDIYMVHDEDWLKDYYGGQAATGSQDFSKINAGDYYSTDRATGAITVNSDAKKVATVTTETKGSDKGVAKKDGLALGLYLVVETKAPDKVTAPAAPFLVSVPMTRIADSTDTNALTDWIYDVHVYPKNGTTYGEVKIHKTAHIGSGKEVDLEGVTFTLQKFNTTTNTWNDVTTSESDNKEFVLKTNASGIVSVSGLSQGKYHFIEQSIAGNNTYIIDQTPIEFVVTKEGKIKYGEKEEAAITIPVVNEGTKIEKQITDKNNELTNHTDYSIGDHVPYQIKVTVPQNIKKLTTFTVTDTPTNLKFDGTTSNFSVQCNSADVDGTAYTVTPVDNGFTIKFSPDKMTAYAGNDIIIKYTATLQATAKQTIDGNTNSASLKYTNKIGVGADGKPTEIETKETKDEAVVYTFKVKVHKTADDTQKGLKDVEFDLYKEDANGEVAGNDASALGLDASKKWTKINKKKLVSDTNGDLEQGGLANGHYYLVETKTAKGYNLLKSPVEVILNIEETTTFTKKPDGTITKTTTFKGGDAEDIGEHTVNVVNRKGFTLPVTGGFGTLLFSGIGVLLVLAGVGVLFSLKKKPNRA